MGSLRVEVVLRLVSFISECMKVFVFEGGGFGFLGLCVGVSGLGFSQSCANSAARFELLRMSISRG